MATKATNPLYLRWRDYQLDYQRELRRRHPDIKSEYNRRYREKQRARREAAE